MLQEKWRTFDRFQKSILCILMVMPVLFAALTGVSRSQKGILFHDAILHPATDGSTIIYSGRSHLEAVTITVTPISDTETALDFIIGDTIHDHCVVEYPLAPIQTEAGEKPGLRILCNDTVRFQGAYDPADYREYLGYMLYDQNSQTSITNLSELHVYGGGNSYWEYYETTVGAILKFANGTDLVARGSWTGFFVATLLAGWSVLEVAFPLELFQWNYRRYVRHPEPTEFYLSTTRLVSVVIAVFALIGYILALRTFP